MGLYTRSGDDGTTGLFGGGRVGKDHPRVEAYGAVDELNAWLGLAAAGSTGSSGGNSGGGSGGGALGGRVEAMLAELRSRLFDLGSDLATPLDSPHRDKVAPLTADDVREIEGWIDEIDAGNEPIRQFILPGGTELAARLHLARTVCRRAERRVISLRTAEPVNAQALIYLNRLSDLLFALARRVNREAGVPDVPWRKKA